MNKKYLLVLIALFTVYSGIAQEGLAPLQRNDVLHSKAGNEFKPEALDRFTYQFLLDTIHIDSIMDDFSKNYFKSYRYDTNSPLVDTLVWIRFLIDSSQTPQIDSTYTPQLLAMLDTSYTYPYDSVNQVYDSVANEPLYVIYYSLSDYQMPIDTDTLWIRPDTIFVGSSIITNHSADVTLLNYRDSVIVVPDEGFSIWRNNNALHNYTYGDDPLTVGVVTFDGLDSTGVPYDPTMNPNSYQIADVLESKPIYLRTRPNGGADYDFINDTIYLSFYYQPQGLGDAPEPEDSLILQFYSPLTDEWKTMWKASGETVHPFKSVMVRVPSPIYFLDGFKFRFFNYASVSGNFDHWNIDYVVLDEGRDINDTTVNDVGLLTPGHSLLKDYSQMPWKHYKNSTANLMKDKQEITFRNTYDLSKLTNSTLNAFENGNLVIDGSDEITPILAPFAKGSEFSTIPNEYPKTYTDSVQSFHVLFTIETTPDDNPDNDTVDFHQQFGTQYAYDDGSAESAYFVTSAGAQIAVEYNIAIADTLKAVNIYFPRSYENILDRSFRVMVWKSLSPEIVLYESYLNLPAYSGSRDFVVGYELEEPLQVEGQIFVGIEQLDKRIFIGLDRNNDNQFKNFFNVGGNWMNSSYQGSLFIRPEFGVTTSWPVTVNELEKEKLDFKVYPNPTNSVVNVRMTGYENTVILRSLLGVQIRSFDTGQDLQFEVFGLPTGLYLIEVTDHETGQTNIKKLLIQN